MRPPILRWKVIVALVGVVVLGAVLGSVLRPNGKEYSFSGVQYFGGSAMSSVHIQSAVPVYGPAKTPPAMRRRICASMRAELPQMSKHTRRVFVHGMPGFCKRH